MLAMIGSDSNRPRHNRVHSGILGSSRTHHSLHPNASKLTHTEHCAIQLVLFISVFVLSLLEAFIR